MPKKYNLTPLQADKLYHRWMQVKDGGVCEQSICPETLDKRILADEYNFGKCNICYKLFDGILDFHNNKSGVRIRWGCPCYGIINDNEILHHVRAALEEFYGEPLV